jgi:hypothetical protein
MELNVMPQADAVLHHSWLVWMFYPNMLMVFLQSEVNQTTCLYKADLAALTGDTVYTQCPQSLVILDQPKESTVILGRSPTNLMCQDSTLLMWLRSTQHEARKWLNLACHWVEDWQLCKSAGCCSHSAWKCPSETPLHHEHCHGCTQL